MPDEKRDRELGMDRGISRRDFLNGVAVGIGGALASTPMRAALLLSEPPTAAKGVEKFAPEEAAGYYPPALTGMRGNHDGSFPYAHRLRDGEAWDADGSPQKTGESYDLVVVGGGISGLAAAYFFRKSAGDKARILVLDNHDDFGGHAKRNEFRSGGRTALGDLDVTAAQWVEGLDADPEAVDYVRAFMVAMGGSRLAIFRHVKLPATYTPLFSALKLSATFSVTGAW